MNFFARNILNIKNKILREIIYSLITIVNMSGIICLVYFLNIPNPNLVTFTGLIVFTTLFGFIPGSFALVGLNIYSLYFFSTNNDFISFNEQNLQKMIVVIVTSAICYLFVGALNYFFTKTTLKYIEINNELVKNNEQLREISTIDSLTQVKNRFSLREDFESYIGKEIQMLIFDVDEFKHINDTYGHQGGDIILEKIGEKAKKIFGNNNVYRFGGDEFIIIAKDVLLEEFKEKIEKFKKTVEVAEVENNSLSVHISGGYTYGIPTDVTDLRQMIKFSDNLLYEVKRSGKNSILEKKYDLDIMK